MKKYNETAELGNFGLQLQEQKTLADQYTGKAIALLKKMAEGDYFDDSEHLAELESNDDLAPLRAHREYVEFLKSIQGKPNDP